MHNSPWHGNRLLPPLSCGRALRVGHQEKVSLRRKSTQWLATRPAWQGQGIAWPEVSSAEEFCGASDDAVDDRGVEECGGVAELVVLAAGHLAEDAAHDLARARFGQARRELDAVWAGDVADLGVDLDADFLAQGRDAFGACRAGRRL